MKNNHRTGSALLIVLGMLSFMVVSAVAFSIFMRQGRLPSSFLRQRILARQLVKAGLAHAMSDIDSAIGDDPYPNEYRVPKTGAGGAGTYLGSTHGWANSSNRNYWRNRVFMGRSGDGYPDDDNTHLANTVSTFPLEGLAYIPPPLVNTVRYWARRSPAATWKTLDYDSGRYAFTAVNVSDYLDINRLKANVMRSSSPANRISLAYLFENAGHTGWGALTPKAFDEKMKSLESGQYGRLVSLADYNLALSSDAGGPLAGCGFLSQFCEFIKSPPGGAEFCTDEDQARMQKFITDSWYPGTNTTGLVLTDLSRGQPFDGLNESLDDLQGNGSDAFKIFRERLDICTLGALYDYLDDDDVPISLAIPTIERAPMLTGINITPSGFELSLDGPTTVEEKDGLASPKKKDEYQVWTVKSLGDPRIDFSACGVFPFKRKSGMTPLSYRAQVRVTLFFSDGAFAETRLADSDLPFRPTGDGDWKAETALMATDKGWMTLVGEGNVSFKNGALTDSETFFDIKGVTLNVPADAIANAAVYGWFKKYKLDENESVIDDGPPTYDATHLTKPLVYRSGGSARTVGDNLKLHLCYACWVRIIDGNGKTVDLIPAQQRDDKGYNGFDSGTLPDYDRISGYKTPLLPIASGDLLDLNVQNAQQSKLAVTGADQGNLAIYCDDPRYNWAPEDWYTADGGQVQGSVWLTEAQKRCDGNERRPNDIFQFVSDQGVDYLQSMGELQFLPYVTDFRKKGNPFSGAFFNAGKYNGTPFADRKSTTDLANKDYAWKTHWGFGEFADHEQDGEECCPYEWGIQDTNGGVAVNPYADEDLFLAALANTPYDYAIAAEPENAADKDLEANIQYCFNERSSEAKLEWTKLKEIAKRIAAKFATGEEWEEWAEWDQEDFFGQQIANFDDVDRKFLFSYWKQCFANNQQLFLIFVRAEPTVIGGSSAGHTPSQLGARAVALVWRDPAGIASSSVQGGGSSQKAHKMRILFYHQFE